MINIATHYVSKRVNSLRKRLNQEKGSALITVLVVLFILLTAFFAVFSFAINRAGIIRNEINHTRASYLAEAGINRFLHIINSDSLDWQDATNLKIKEKISDKESFQVKASLWGGYILVVSEGKAHAKKVKKKALVGKLPDREINAGIINGSEYYPVVVAGNTLIRGDAIVGPESVTCGSFEGEAYHGEMLVDGSIIIKKSVELADIDEEAIKKYLDIISDKKSNRTQFISGSYLMRELSTDNKNNSQIIVVEDNLEINSLKFDSGQEEISIIANGDIIIKGDCNINGWVEVAAGESIVVEGNANISNVLLVAEDSIIFKDSVIFSGQAICNHEIRVKNGAWVEYPSYFYSFNQDNSEFGKIEFGGGTYSQLIAIADNQKDDFLKQPAMIFIDTGALVSGYLYSTDYSDIRGALWGISLTRNYWYYKEPTTYINWLRNAYINRERLDFLPILPVSLCGQNGYSIFNMPEEV